MERKKVIGVGVVGPLPELPDPREAVWLAAAPDRGTLLFGIGARQETDAQAALAWAGRQLAEGRRIVVKHLNVAVENGKPRFDWEPAFGRDLADVRPGEALVSPDIARIYERRFLFERADEGGRQLFFLRGERARPTRLHGLSPELPALVGRNAEFRRLTELAEQVSNDQGQVASLVGPAGVGKSRLLAEFKTWLQAENMPFFEGAHGQGDANPYAGLQRITAALGTSPRHREALSELTGADRDFLTLFLSPGRTVDRLTGLTEDEVRNGLFEASRRFLHAAARTPLVLILEDFHWAGPGTVSLLQKLLEGFEGTRLLILTLHRTEFTPPWGRLLNFTEIPLLPFGEDETRDFLKALLRVAQVPTRFQREIQRLSLGNPLYIEELLRQLVETGHLSVEADDRGRRFVNVPDAGIADMPATLHSLISSRFDHLEPDLRDFLRWASLFGFFFDTDEFEAFLAHQGVASPAEKMQDVIERNYVAERSTFPSRIHQFTHDLIFDVVGETIPERERMRRHTAIGRFLQKHHAERPEAVIDRVAEHFLKGEPHMEAFQTAIRAGEALSASHQYERALYFYREASRCLEKQTLK